MNCYDKTKKAIEMGNTPGKEMYLAYLQLHRNNPGLHPDSYLCTDGGYCGWHVLLVNRIVAGIPDLPDSFTYPTFINPMSTALGNLIDFHADDEDPELHTALNTIVAIFDDLHLEDLPEVLAYLDKLLIYHTGGPEEIVDYLCNAHEALHWITQL